MLQLMSRLNCCGSLTILFPKYITILYKLHLLDLHEPMPRPKQAGGGCWGWCPQITVRLYKISFITVYLVRGNTMASPSFMDFVPTALNAKRNSALRQVAAEYNPELNDTNII